jgi:hypothetical protein
VAELQITAVVLGMLAVKTAVIVSLVYVGVRLAIRNRHPEKR